MKNGTWMKLKKRVCQATRGPEQMNYDLIYSLIYFIFKEVLIWKLKNDRDLRTKCMARWCEHECASVKLGQNKDETISTVVNIPDENSSHVGLCWNNSCILPVPPLSVPVGSKYWMQRRIKTVCFELLIRATTRIRYLGCSFNRFSHSQNKSGINVHIRMLTLCQRGCFVLRFPQSGRRTQAHFLCVYLEFHIILSQAHKQPE